ncbi:uncharacterized protein LOC119597511 [Penaeus monodon]|uniref:uncharacterized protein LOC119597511 n=1 Tax=Penaeus monodon TaxID=6687 RepID=UPI0018A7B1D9|nr:uncharacterized protein LOC119597511 [Penaeus monodon]
MESTGRAGVKILLEIFTELWKVRNANEWRDSTLIRYSRTRGTSRNVVLPGHQTDVTHSENMGRIIDGRLRAIVTISEQQFGFHASRSTTDQYLRETLMEKYREVKGSCQCLH